jgi:hypothetical protein
LGGPNNVTCTSAFLIQDRCLAPDLVQVQVLSFERLDLSRGCVATASYYGNTLCAINGPQSTDSTLATLWTVESLGDYQWLHGIPPTQSLNSTAGLPMLLSALPNQY